MNVAEVLLTEMISNKKCLIIKWIKYFCYFSSLAETIKVFDIKRFDLMKISIMFFICSYCHIKQILYLRICVPHLMARIKMRATTYCGSDLKARWETQLI